MAMIRMESVNTMLGLHTMPTTPFGVLIREARLSKGLSQGELGYRIGRDQSYISDIERGKNKRPDDWAVRRLAAELGLDEARLFDALGVAVKLVDGFLVSVIGLIPADSVRFTSRAGVSIPEVKMLPEDIRKAHSPDDVYGLQVTGDCMIRIGILPGDVVIVEPATVAPENGQLVVVRVGDEVSLKRWSLFRETVELRDGNDEIIWRGQPHEIEVIALYVTYKPLAKR